MKDQNTSGPRPETRASEMKRTKEMAHVPHPNLQYPVAAALSTPSNCARPVSTRQSPNSTFLSPTVNGTHPTQYSPERVPLSPARSASRGRQGSNSTSRHHDSPIVSVPDHERSRHQHHPQPRWNNHSPSDSEKAIHARQSPPNGHRPGQDRSSFVSEDEKVIEEHAVWILVRLVPMISPLQSTHSNGIVKLGLSVLPLARCGQSRFHLQPRHRPLPPPLLPHHRLHPTSETVSLSDPVPTHPGHILPTALRLLHVQIRPAPQHDESRR